jgi:hypothetical protein
MFVTTSSIRKKSTFKCKLDDLNGGPVARSETRGLRKEKKVVNEGAFHLKMMTVCWFWGASECWGGIKIAGCPTELNEMVGLLVRMLMEYLSKGLHASGTRRGVWFRSVEIRWNSSDFCSLVLHMSLLQGVHEHGKMGKRKFYWLRH